MAYNKSKHLDAAQKYLQQGKLPQAIAEYQQILKNEPKDQVTLMTLGDLFVRQGETFQALEYFERLAKLFLNDGFTTKAIAIYKKVAKLAPEEGRPMERLAELYVQQGVLSEARPIYLQLAEAHLKAGRQPQAVVLLRKLLEAEPDNLRVQIRLAELHLSMGQQKDAIDMLHGAIQRVLDQGDHAEAIRLADKVLKLDPTHQATFHLKIKALSASGKGAEAANLLESVPDQDAGGEMTNMLLDQYAASGEKEKAAALAERVYAREPKNYLIAHRVANTLLEAGDLDRARNLLAMVRDTMIDSGDHEVLAQSITKLAEGRPGQVEPLEWLVDLYGRASDSFRLPDALAQLAQAYEFAGDDTKAIATYQQLLERTPEDETTRRKYMRLCTKTGFDPASAGVTPPVKIPPTQAAPQAATSGSSEPALEEETQRYITQVLTDVDLFSSYGLTQKAIDLLEVALERAPGHMPILERLLDLSVGAGNDRRTAELAAILEKIAIERQDKPASERYAEFRRRFQKAAGISPSAAAPSPVATAPDAPQEFAVPMIEAELDEPVAEVPVDAKPMEPAAFPVPVESAVHEVDLSDEWAALSQQLEDAVEQDAPISQLSDAVVEQAEAALPEPEAISEAASLQADENIAAEFPAFELELQPVVLAGAAEQGASAEDTMAGDALIADLMADLESATNSLELPEELAQAARPVSPQMPAPLVPPSTPLSSANGGAAAALPADSVSLDGPLGDLFEEFRAELGEMNKDDEDLETHYNLGIAYREMGLLEEAISEFQKVAQSADKGPAFRYAMQCSTLLGLAFMEKGQPAIAAIWYERALKTPGLDQESIMALRYDLGVAQELAGEHAAAYASFSQVYALNIDYRDVSERIALLGKAH
jgi:tetratricopeptide (TPR) repeat protein